MMMIRAAEKRGEQEEEMSCDLITTPNFSFNEYYAVLVHFPSPPPCPFLATEAIGWASKWSSGRRRWTRKN